MKWKDMSPEQKQRKLAHDNASKRKRRKEDSKYRDKLRKRDRERRRRKPLTPAQKARRAELQKIRAANPAHRAKANQASRRHQQKRRADPALSAAEKKKRRRRYYLGRKIKVAWLLDHPCVDCGETDIRQLTFDHIPQRGRKRFNISQGANWSIESLEAEILKCEVRCKSCHRKKTAERKVGTPAPSTPKQLSLLD